ncbi:MAG: serine hydrolase domain-containing protein, partial [Pseudomonadota bacterium]|nr:serine hydrolase domain-containing protein [Pseudomonadota bacterium]
MKHLLLTTIAAVLASSLVTVNITAEPRVINSSTISDFFDVAFNTQKQDHELVGMVVSVVHKGKVIFKKGYGFADLEKRIHADPDKHLFRIASISKTFIWTAVMQLVE